MSPTSKSSRWRPKGRSCVVTGVHGKGSADSRASRQRAIGNAAKEAVVQSPVPGDPSLDGRARTLPDAPGGRKFWHRILFGRWAIAIGLSIVYASSPAFGSDRIPIAVLMM